MSQVTINLSNELYQILDEDYYKYFNKQSLLDFSIKCQAITRQESRVYRRNCKEWMVRSLSQKGNMTIINSRSIYTLPEHLHSQIQILGNDELQSISKLGILRMAEVCDVFSHTISRHLSKNRIIQILCYHMALIPTSWISEMTATTTAPIQQPPIQRSNTPTQLNQDYPLLFTTPTQPRPVQRPTENIIKVDDNILPNHIAQRLLSDKDDCIICMDNLETDTIVVSKCGHFYCKTCLALTISMNNPKCGQCRVPFR